ncbi:helix-turn-helix transcriptional regulator [Vreelandella olivaria]|uniref:helix-turn-helix transcriptional regulator n=1 Tax=Vreelandella olivaria TaxID=390919 RepID=UPI00201EA8D4|nr:AraC family transcriptional regulator [Halomonas olivaria]
MTRALCSYLNGPRSYAKLEPTPIPSRGHRLLRPGLSLYFERGIEAQDAERNANLDNSISLVMLLEGELDLRFGNQHLKLNAGRYGSNKVFSPTMALVTINQVESFCRTTRQGDFSRRISLNLSHKWLEQSLCGDTIDDTSATAAQLEKHLSTRQWKASSRACELAEQMLTPPPLPPELISLYLESRALDLFLDAWSHCTRNQDSRPARGISTRNYYRMCELASWLKANTNIHLSLEQIATEANTTTATLQRHFRQAHGLSVFEFLQHARLEKARLALQSEGISVSEASDMAGYSHTTSFSTAFKRHFGISPKQVFTRKAR